MRRARRTLLGLSAVGLAASCALPEVELLDHSPYSTSGGTESGGDAGAPSGGITTAGSGGITTAGSGGSVTAGTAGTTAAGSGGIATAGSGGITTAGSGGSVTAGTAGTVAGAAGTAGVPATGGSGGTVATGGAAGAAGAGGGCPGGECPCGTIGPSCNGGLDCSGESCCTALSVEGGSFNRTYAAALAVVSGYCLDKYEVTVGRFRAFVSAYDDWRLGPHPVLNEGEHPLVEDSGWQDAWTTRLPATADLLQDTTHADCAAANRTWTDEATANESFPINCVSWYEAFAFCLWDGGHLPTEAEWELAAAGGAEDRLYPWGNDEPATLPASYSGNHNTPLLSVNSEPGGRGRWGHRDLAGSMFEWNLDAYVFPYPIDPCEDCAVLTGSTESVIRGGGWNSSLYLIRTQVRDGALPESRSEYLGFRCARSL